MFLIDETHKNAPLTVVIPAHNEQFRIRRTILNIKAHLETVAVPYEILVVVNNSSDSTLAVIKNLQRNQFKNNSCPEAVLRYLNVPVYTGKGGAVCLGFQCARYDIVAMVDADGSSSAAEIYKLYTKVRDDITLDGVLGSRYMPGGEIVGKTPIVRKYLGSIFRSVVKMLFGLKFYDTQCGYKVFRKHAAVEFADRISTVGWSFDVNMLLLAKYLNYNIVEEPVVWKFSRGSQLKASWVAFEVLRDLGKLKLLEFRLNIPVRLSHPDILSKKIHSWSMNFHGAVEPTKIS